MSLPPIESSTRSMGRLRLDGGHHCLVTVCAETPVLPYFQTGSV
jgi:hypothetical protein